MKPYAEYLGAFITTLSNFPTYFKEITIPVESCKTHYMIFTLKYKLTDKVNTKTCFCLSGSWDGISDIFKSCCQGQNFFHILQLRKETVLSLTCWWVPVCQPPWKAHPFLYPTTPDLMEEEPGNSSVLYTHSRRSKSCMALGNLVSL